MFVVALLVMSGCGGGKSIPKADLIRKGDQICKTDMAKVEKAANTTPNLSERDAIARVLLPGLRTMFNKIKALGTPPNDNGKLHKIYDRLDRLVKAGGSGSKFETLEGDFQDLGRALQAYGFKVCGH